MVDDVLHEPRVLYYFRHASGIDLDVAITTPDGWKMTLLPDIDWVRKIVKRKVLSATALERISGMENDNLKRITAGTCCNPECEDNGVPYSGVDRGRPLCEDCWTTQSAMTEKMAARYYTPPEVELDDKDPYGLLFG